ncbi:CvpA family protein [Elongatibacter sediminis]|uniref:CvpA family protein n=1 Tax=Elongatibacter sediminis TaxID=3119006 RepID=A0AAW9RDB0_9GAMM
MDWPDYAILATIVISLLVGALRGFMKEVFSLVTWAAAFVVAYRFSGDVAALMEPHVSLPSVRTAMGFAGLFLLVLVVGGLLNYLIGLLVETTGLTGTDRLLGGAFGAARGLAIVVAFLLIAGFTPIPKDPWWQSSAMIARLMPLVLWTTQYLPEAARDQLDFTADLPAEETGSEGAEDPPGNDAESEPA